MGQRGVSDRRVLGEHQNFRCCYGFHFLSSASHWAVPFLALLIRASCLATSALRFALPAGSFHLDAPFLSAFSLASAETISRLRARILPTNTRLDSRSIASNSLRSRFFSCGRNEAGRSYTSRKISLANPLGTPRSLNSRWFSKPTSESNLSGSRGRPGLSPTTTGLFCLPAGPGPGTIDSVVEAGLDDSFDEVWAPGRSCRGIRQWRATRTRDEPSWFPDS